MKINALTHKQIGAAVLHMKFRTSIKKNPIINNKAKQQRKIVKLVLIDGCALAHKLKRREEQKKLKNIDRSKEKIKWKNT